jgi:hypothetical protein
MVSKMFFIKSCKVYIIIFPHIFERALDITSNGFCLFFMFPLMAKMESVKFEI